ncbi:MAG: hypothetical protein HOQ10_14900 [Frateuria sp.]|uniref:hypothetical protein n=1 Tax=Frateuria sp. TaxID=2211372 RepID=UPI0017986457|nr:hypothetical protein [Frateuria sp.]NUO73983.1 hypothetical protein [Frateuria sp.]NUR24133.1 hypothetical protein [Frateuria sp.]
MQILKLALPLAGMLMAGQALAHKVSRTMVTSAAAVRLAPAQTDTNPAALLDGIAGRSAPGITMTPALTPRAMPTKSTETSTRITRHH